MSSLPSTLKAHPVLALLARYRDVFKTAWAARSELAGPSRLATERAFLPAALSLQETPVHPAPRRAAWAIVAFFACSLAWAVIGELDVVAIASGRIVVSERTKVIQPLEPAVVRAIRVKDGDRVKAGQLLVELDPTGVHADMASQQVQRNASESEAQRSEVAVGHGRGAGGIGAG